MFLPSLKAYEKGIPVQSPPSSRSHKLHTHSTAEKQLSTNSSVIPERNQFEVSSTKSRTNQGLFLVSSFRHTARLASVLQCCCSVVAILFDWCFFYYFVRNSLIALLEALCARIVSLRFVNIGFVSAVLLQYTDSV